VRKGGSVRLTVDKVEPALVDSTGKEFPGSAGL
jgi:hypothetical protein